MKIEVEKEHLQTLYDMVTGSLDYGSGFFDGDDIDTLHAVGRLLGVDESGNPLRTTPHLWHQDCALKQVCGAPQGDLIHRPELPS